MNLYLCYVECYTTSYFHLIVRTTVTTDIFLLTELVSSERFRFKNACSFSIPTGFLGSRSPKLSCFGDRSLLVSCQNAVTTIFLPTCSAPKKMVRSSSNRLVLAAACAPSLVYGFLNFPSAPSPRLLPLASTTVKRPDVPLEANGVTDSEGSTPDFDLAPATVPLDGINPVEPAFERYKAISTSALDEWAEKHPRLQVYFPAQLHYFQIYPKYSLFEMLPAPSLLSALAPPPLASVDFHVPNQLRTVQFE